MNFAHHLSINSKQPLQREQMQAGFQRDGTEATDEIGAPAEAILPTSTRTRYNFRKGCRFPEVGQRIADLKLARLCCAEQQHLARSDSIRAKDQGKKRTLEITKSDVCMDGKK